MNFKTTTTLIAFGLGFGMACDSSAAPLEDYLEGLGTAGNRTIMIQPDKGFKSGYFTVEDVELYMPNGASLANIVTAVKGADNEDDEDEPLMIVDGTSRIFAAIDEATGAGIRLKLNATRGYQWAFDYEHVLEEQIETLTTRLLAMDHSSFDFTESTLPNFKFALMMDYKDYNPDELPSDVMALLNRYGKTIFSRFDPRLYGISNPDISGAGPAEGQPYNSWALGLAKHYVDNGQREGRQLNRLPATFNHIEYMDSYPDLSGFAALLEPARRESLEAHYLVSGVGEQRQMSRLPAGFSSELYAEMYPGLAGMSDSQRKSHYLKHVLNGQEDRVAPVLPADFSPVQYRLNNADLTGMTDLQAGSHWLLHGQNEGRSYK